MILYSASCEMTVWGGGGGGGGGAEDERGKKGRKGKKEGRCANTLMLNKQNSLTR